MNFLDKYQHDPDVPYNKKKIRIKNMKDAIKYVRLLGDSSRCKLRDDQ